MSSRPHIRIEMQSNPQYLAGARELISGVCRRIGFTEMCTSQIALAVDEALCNVMRHGYDKQTDRPIWVSLWPDTHAGKPEITIVIEDEARHVDPCQIKGRDLDDVKPGGLGVHIIREVMDRAEYEKRPGRGMKLTMVKKQPDHDKPGGECNCS
ncbi:MAG: ATP-binding protein [Phycisphaerae bacterium]|nr:ATP-binding protein [Phycisphaerae bacterium]